jgi:hypothetical protein
MAGLRAAAMTQLLPRNRFPLSHYGERPCRTLRDDQVNKAADKAAEAAEAWRASRPERGRECTQGGAVERDHPRVDDRPEAERPSRRPPLGGQLNRGVGGRQYADQRRAARAIPIPASW